MSTGWTQVLQGFGVFLVLLPLEDIFFTVLFPGSQRGIIRIPLSRVEWALFRWTSRFAGRWRRHFLSYSGPILIAAHVTCWVILFLAGFACISWPMLGATILSSSGPTPKNFVTAFYYSGFTFTTLGNGSPAPKTGPYRILEVLEAVLGFASVTLVLTYFQSVYSAMVRRNTFAARLQMSTRRTGNAAELLAGLGPGGEFSGSTQTLGEIGEEMLNVLESHRAYPVLRYFHFRRSQDALARLLLVPLDTATLIQAALPTESYRSLVESSALHEVWEGGLYELDELIQTFVPRRFRALAEASASEGAWRAHYSSAVQRLRRGGIETVSDSAAGAERYVAMRRTWDGKLRALAAYMAHDWDDIAPYESGAVGGSGEHDERRTLASRS